MINKSICKIYIVDDEEDLREGISLLLKSYNYNAESFGSIDQFLHKATCNNAGCILLDVFLGGKTGIELQVEIETKFEFLPIIFMTGKATVSMSVEALKKGAIDFLEKPIDEKQLLSAIELALNKSISLITKHSEIEKFKQIVNSLTAREYEIFRCVICGMLNKQIAYELGIAEHTVKNHRMNITNKLGVKSVPEMIYIAEKLSIKGFTTPA